MLQWMHDQYKVSNADVKPNTVSYFSTITAWAKSGDPAAGHRGEARLRQMQKCSDAGNTDVRPDTVSFNFLLG